MGTNGQWWNCEIPLIVYIWASAPVIVGHRIQYIWSPVPWLSWGRGGHMRSGTFLYEIWFPNNFYLKLFFWMWCVFLAAFSPKVDVFSLFSTILYFNHINLSSPLPHSGRGDALVDFFVRNSISNNFYLKLLGCDAYFWQRWALNCMYFGVSACLPYNVIT